MIPKDVWPNIITGFFTLAAAFGAIIIQCFLKRGDLVFYVSNFEMPCFKSDEMGGLVPADLDDDISHGSIKISLDVFNCTEVPNSLRDIVIEYNTDNRRKRADVKDLDTGRKVGPVMFYDSLKVLNFMPRTMYHFDLESCLDVNDFPIIEQDVWLVAKDYKDKEYRVKLGIIPLKHAGE